MASTTATTTNPPSSSSPFPPRPGRLANKVALITGGSSGIGRAISLAFAAEGARVLITDLSESSRDPAESEPTATVARSLGGGGGEAEFLRVDVTDAASVDAAVAAAVARWGRLDVMVNNAGVTMDVHAAAGAPPPMPPPVWEVDDERWAGTMAVNATGVFNGVRAAARQMVGQEPLASGDRGSIINLASVLGLVGMRNCVPYTASKHAVIGLTKAAALDLAPHRVHVNALCPGYTKSSMTSWVWENPRLMAAFTAAHPFRGLGETDDIARAAVFLASDDAGWVSGIGLPVDGGYTCQ